MKKLFLSAGLVLVLSIVAFAQTCPTTGFCPTSIMVHHVAGPISPVTVDITYEVDKNAYSGTTQCWIARNLGATTQAASGTDGAAASAGWYWQFNRKQGYSYNGSRVPATTWTTSISENSNWLAANDPCTLLLGSTWRLPTSTEWNSAPTAGSFNSGYTAAYSSTLMLHAAGSLDGSGALYSRGTTGFYWSSTSYSTTNGGYLYLTSSSAGTASNDKALGFSVRCLRTY